jgi:hypothetical protein
MLVALALAAQDRVAELPQDNWSAVSNGIRGRLIATPIPDPRGAQFRLELELQNVTNALQPIEIWWSNWNDMLKFGLQDETGASAGSEVQPGGNQQVLPPFWLQLLPQSSMRATVAGAAFEYIPATRPDRLLLRPTVFQGWFLPLARTSRLYLHATLTPQKSRDSRRSQWVGPLALPRVALP